MFHIFWNMLHVYEFAVLQSDGPPDTSVLRSEFRSLVNEAEAGYPWSWGATEDKWRFPESWGYPSSSSISRWDFPVLTSQLLGYPHWLWKPAERHKKHHVVPHVKPIVCEPSPVYDRQWGVNHNKSRPKMVFSVGITRSHTAFHGPTW